MRNLGLNGALSALPDIDETNEILTRANHNGLSLMRRGLTSMLKRGPSHTLRWGWFHLNEHFYERLLGVRTSRDDSWNAESYERTGERVQYEPLPYTLINTILSSVARRDVTDDVFLDYGCGMGRVVLMAARKPFKRVIGVELFETLLSVAQQNAAIAGPHLKSQVALQNADAAHFVVPDDVSIIHLFNPFRGDIMRETQERIRESLLRRPRRLTVFYAHPHDQENLFGNCRYLSLKNRLPEGALRGMNLLVYEHRPGIS